MVGEIFALVSIHQLAYSLLLWLCYVHVDVVFFRKWLGRYRLEHIQAKACPTEKDLGLLLVDTNQLKAQLLPSPVKCLEVLFHFYCMCVTSPGPS